MIARIRTAFTLILFVAVCEPVFAKWANRQSIGQAGKFELYVLALSWSPAFCASKPENIAITLKQCELKSGFVLHGLWPQAKEGQNPQFCRTGDNSKVTPEEAAPVWSGKVASPSGSLKLLEHEWRKHGVCSGLGQEEYFRLSAMAAERVNVPNFFENLNEPAEETAEGIVRHFVKANPGLTPSQIVPAVNRDGFFSEVKICMTKELQFTDCHNVRAVAPETQVILLPAFDVL